MAFYHARRGEPFGLARQQLIAARQARRFAEV